MIGYEDDDYFLEEDRKLTRRYKERGTTDGLTSGEVSVRTDSLYLASLAKLPPEMIHLHDAIFHEKEKVESQEIVKKKYWWDEDVKPQDPVEHKVNWYIRNWNLNDNKDNENEKRTGGIDVLQSEALYGGKDDSPRRRVEGYLRKTEQKS